MVLIPFGSDLGLSELFGKIVKLLTTNKTVAILSILVITALIIVSLIVSIKIRIKNDSATLFSLSTMLIAAVLTVFLLTIVCIVVRDRAIEKLEVQLEEVVNYEINH